MVRKNNTLYLCILIFLVTIVPAVAEVFTFSGNRMNTILAQGRERTVLQGDAVIVSDETEIQANNIELYGEDFRYALCSGSVNVNDTSRGIGITSEHLFFDREERITRVEGSMIMEDFENEMVIRGGFLEDRDDEDITIIQIGVRILKADMVCRAEFARYLREEDILELSGMPVVFMNDDEYRAARITIHLETEEVFLEGEVTGRITSEDEETETDESAESGETSEGTETMEGQDDTEDSQGEGEEPSETGENTRGQQSSDG
ncbi:MAG: organic solvent tolerance protein OstA [Spirochaetia bacterium]